MASSDFLSYDTKAKTAYIPASSISTCRFPFVHVVQYAYAVEKNPLSPKLLRQLVIM